MSRLLLVALLLSALPGATAMLALGAVAVAQEQTTPPPPQTPSPRSGRGDGDCHHPPVTS